MISYGVSRYQVKGAQGLMRIFCVVAETIKTETFVGEVPIGGDGRVCLDYIGKDNLSSGNVDLLLILNGIFLIVVVSYLGC